MLTFDPSIAARLPGPPWLSARRAAAAEAFSGSALPTEKDEVWRYSRIDRLDLDRFAPAVPGTTLGSSRSGLGASSERALAVVSHLVDLFGPRCALVVTVNGLLAASVPLPPAGDGVRVGRLADHEEGDALFGSVAERPSDFVLLNEAFAPDPLVVDVAPGTVVDTPVVIVHLVDVHGGVPGEETGGDPALFPRTFIRAGARSRVGVVEISVGAGHWMLAPRSAAVPAVPVPPIDGPGAGAPAVPGVVVVPVTELAVGDRAVLDYVSLQALGAGAWQLAHQASTIGEDAGLRSFAVALGGSYARLRTDSTLAGSGGASELRAAYLGTGDQMLDFRTLQDHAAPRTTSDLLFKGAVADRAHSVYSGLIRVRRGALRSDAMQTNHNLVLDEGAHADSVPNLDIEENDVRCSHASTVGPIDEDQRYYLESRGVDPAAAERLIVAGFFADIAGQAPIASVRPAVREALGRRLVAEVVRGSIEDLALLTADRGEPDAPISQSPSSSPGDDAGGEDGRHG
ncbi:MAG: SufD family Fe-S cluster assembly protein [Actinomycetota bacterium]|nr:SufD family Fe-S cluster assembly protein [Actinomycetota bacterium]